MSDDGRLALYANVAYDPVTWLALPTYWGTETWDDPVAWAAETARDMWRGLDPGPRSVARTEAMLTECAQLWGGRDPDLPFEMVTYLHLPHPGMLPVQVRVWIDDTPHVTVRWAAQADEATAVEPPVVEEFTTEHLGTGLRVRLYHSFTPGGAGSGNADALCASLRYAFTTPEHDAVLTVWAMDPDLGRLIQAGEDIDAFVRAVQCDAEPLDLVTRG